MGKRVELGIGIPHLLKSIFDEPIEGFVAGIAKLRASRSCTSGSWKSAMTSRSLAAGCRSASHRPAPNGLLRELNGSPDGGIRGRQHGSGANSRLCRGGHRHPALVHMRRAGDRSRFARSLAHVQHLRDEQAPLSLNAERQRLTSGTSPILQGRTLLPGRRAAFPRR